MRLLSASLCLAAALSCHAAFAQEAAAPDPEKLAIATRIIELSRADQGIDANVESLVSRMLQNLKARSPSLSDEVVALIGNEVLQEMKNALPAVSAINARIYANHFTLQELEEIEAIYQSPIGRKMSAEMPKIRQEVTPLVRAYSGRAAAQVLQKVLTKLRAKGMKI